MALIPPISSGITPAYNLPKVEAPVDTTAAQGSKDSFGSAVSNVLDSLQAGENKTDALAQQAATGKLKNVEDFLMAASESQLNMQLTVAVRNKAIDSFNDIMRMQV